MGEPANPAKGYLGRRFARAKGSENHQLATLVANPALPPTLFVNILA